MGELVLDLADAFEVPVERVRQDLVASLELLRGHRLLEGLQPEVPESDPEPILGAPPSSSIRLLREANASAPRSGRLPSPSTWAAAVVLEAGDEALASAMRETFASMLIEDQPRPANYSLRLSDDPDRFHVLQRNSCLVVASPDARRVVWALLRHLADHVDPETPPIVSVQALALLRDGEVTLVPTLVEDHLREPCRGHSPLMASNSSTHSPFTSTSMRAKSWSARDSRSTRSA